MSGSKRDAFLPTILIWGHINHRAASAEEMPLECLVFLNAPYEKLAKDFLNSLLYSGRKMDVSNQLKATDCSINNFPSVTLSRNAYTSFETEAHKTNERQVIYRSVI